MEKQLSLIVRDWGCQHSGWGDLIRCQRIIDNTVWILLGLCHCLTGGAGISIVWHISSFRSPNTRDARGSTVACWGINVTMESLIVPVCREVGTLINKFVLVHVSGLALANFQVCNRKTTIPASPQILKYTKKVAVIKVNMYQSLDLLSATLIVFYRLSSPPDVVILVP
ncbi:hypothetical protein J6590_005919 [Homalodisca vitripennis]|nr:hypothetical protein J6590_005919 [Homalodisca vitripennis]